MSERIEDSGREAREAENAQGQTWSGPSQEDWNSFMESQKSIAEQQKGIVEKLKVYDDILSYQSEGEEREDYAPAYTDFDPQDPNQLAWLVDRVISERMKGIEPYVKNAAQDQGRKEMMIRFDKLETDLKKDYPEGFDKTVAERAAFALFEQHGDANKAVEEAAKFAAEVRKTEREEGISSYKASARKGFRETEPEGEGSAVRAEPPAKTYEEVLAKWAGQSEV